MADRRTLNPNAVEFVPSVNALQLAHSSSAALTLTPGHLPQHHQLPPPMLSPLYLSANEILLHEQMAGYYGQPLAKDGDFGQHSPSGTAIDYSNFDLPFFFHDMMSADTDDFNNYLTYRAEYLLGYARTSPEHTREVVDSVVTFGLPRHLSDVSKPEGAAKLAAEMVDLNGGFLVQLIQRLDQDVQMCGQRDRSQNLHGRYSSGHRGSFSGGSGSNSGTRTAPRSPPDDMPVRLAVFIGRLLYELHIGRCRQLPDERPHFVANVCRLIVELLKQRGTCDAAILCLSYCYYELRIVAPQLLGPIHHALQGAPTAMNPELRKAQTDILRVVRSGNIRPREQCLRAHAMPIADLNDEEDEAFEQFLQGSARCTTSIGNHRHLR